MIQVRDYCTRYLVSISNITELRTCTYDTIMRSIILWAQIQLSSLSASHPPRVDCCCRVPIRIRSSLALSACWYLKALRRLWGIFRGLSRYFAGTGTTVAAGRDGKTVVKRIPSSRPVEITSPVVLYRPVPPI